VNLEQRKGETLRDNYVNKVVAFKDLETRFPLEKRKLRIVLCHGVFDVVHPGHLRHLVYAKSQADLLIVSITPDAFIKKGVYRPHFPQNLRALNLAALEMVDFVVIDQHETPVNLIKKLRPNLFAKGSEYGTLANPKTAEEVNALEGYGGRILFTPGDVVFSSTNLIQEKGGEFPLRIRDIVDAEDISRNLVLDSIENLNARVLVVGDTIVDRIVSCVSIGGQTKTPTLSIRQESSTDFVGGAAIVASHLSAAGASVKFLSVVGEDAEAKFVERQLENNGVESLLLRDESRPTTLKQVFESQGYRLLKVDTLDNRPIEEKLSTRIESEIANQYYDIIVFSDFRHGMFIKSRIASWVRNVRTSAMKVADSQVASRWGNITEFQEFDLVTPNEKEARFALGDQESTVANLALAIRRASNSKVAFLKLGDKGMLAVDRTSNEQLGVFPVPAMTKDVVDAVGSGDALLAYGLLSLYKSKDYRIAGIVGSAAGALACENLGNVPIGREKVSAKLKEIL
jgi:rfaE bifunctional protein kinase chain/domain/rfaE bifunctional protein nucleotidyltransferase chain/domain